MTLYFNFHLKFSNWIYGCKYWKQNSFLYNLLGCRMLWTNLHKVYYPDFRLNLAIWLVDIVLISQFELSPLHRWLNTGETWSQRWNMETKPWQIPYPMENWNMRYMVVWIQNHDKFMVLIWKPLDIRLGCKIRINSLYSVQLS